MSRAWKVVIGLAALVVGANLAFEALDDATRDPQGPASSSFATSPEGVAAYAELLERYGHPVLRLREELAAAQLDPAATLVLLEPDRLEPAEIEALTTFVSDGGRLVASGGAAGALVGDADVVISRATRVRDREDALPSVRFVATDGGAWTGEPDARVLLESRDAAFLLERRERDGRALLLADASPLQNRLLGQADNAALGLELAGAAPRPVIFVESVHGFAEATGIAAIPSRWWWVLGGLAIAGVLFAISAGKRFGPPERQERELPPPRAEFAEALGTSLAKVRPRSGAVETVRRVVRERLVRAARLPHDADDEALRRAAAELRIEEDGVEAVLGRRSDDAALLALGRLLGELEAADGH